MGFTVRVLPSEHEFDVDDGETVLDAALRHGYAFPYGCRDGVCGSCKGILESGNIDYGEFEPENLDADELANGVTLFCQAHPSSDLTITVREVSAVEDIQVRRLPCRIAHMDHLADDVMRLYLKLPETERLQFLAGQYIDFILRDGRRRSFSIANAPHDDEYIELHIRHIKGGEFTDQVFNSMHERDILRIEGPHGSFFLREDSDRPIILVATGTGFAPVKGIIEHALNEKIARPIKFYWGARTGNDLYLNKLPQQWASEHSNFQYIPVLSRADDDWNGQRGYVQDAVASDHPDLSGFDVYACGLPEMVTASLEAFRQQGLTDENFYSDAFEFAKDTLNKQSAK